ncbi:PAS domain-containing protein [Lentilactobacillus raoultii]|uniref:PAS domain-containing protein n=1 Tax=Lentilactobacillus raoultii TaxID=1987503 RepID=A0ABW3PMI8_9LACO|nr:PAS domain-containing protein [Lentilactobacillus raoultii]
MMAELNPIIKEATVQFKTGTLSLPQIEAIFDALPFEIDFIDTSDRFTWFSNQHKRVHPRTTSQLQETIRELHPGKAADQAEAVITAFKKGEKEHVKIPLKVNDQMIDINYYAVRDSNGHYLGTMECTMAINHLKKLIDSGVWNQDASTGASSHQSGDTTKSGKAANSKSSPKNDATTGPSRLSMKDDRWIP